MECEVPASRGSCMGMSFLCCVDVYLLFSHLLTGVLLALILRDALVGEFLFFFTLFLAANCSLEGVMNGNTQVCK